MSEAFGGQHRKTKRVANWSPPPAAPKPIAPWRYLPVAVVGAALFGALAGIALLHDDQQRRDRLQRWVAMTSDVPARR
jgi:hypothetical protein